MFTILLHSSKTMRSAGGLEAYQKPVLQTQANELAAYIQTLSAAQISSSMHVSKAVAVKTHELFANWDDTLATTMPAIDVFLGDIYSGLQTQSLNASDRAYANDHLLILSGLYGGLRALDSIMPYRLEMGYRLPKKEYQNLYKFWGDAIAQLIPAENTIINVSAAEYTKAALPFLNNRIITPKFMTVGKDGTPGFVTVHAKIARGAFAHWLIKERIDDVGRLHEFDDLNYRFSPELSTPDSPVFVCHIFGGLGLSVRLT